MVSERETQWERHGEGDTVGETARETQWKTVRETQWERHGEGDTVGETVRETQWKTVRETQ